MARSTYSVNLYDIVFLANIVTGLVFTMLLLFSKRINQTANCFLGLALLTIVLWLSWVLAIDIQLDRYLSHWSWFPLQYSLALGPLLYFYVRKLTLPERRFKAADLWHFSPLLLEQSVQFLTAMESSRRKIPTYNTGAFAHLNPVMQLLALISVVAYLCSALRLLKNYHRRIKANVSDADRYQYRWLVRLLTGFFVLWLLWVPFVAVDYFFYNYRLDLISYFPLYILMGLVVTWINVEAFLRPEVILVEMPVQPIKVSKESPSAELLEAGIAVRQKMEANLFYQNAELSLQLLAELLEIHPNELSRIINQGIGQSFNDFINEYRVNEVIRKMQDPGYDHITLLGIAFDSGFNSKTTFNRTFKNLTGKSPVAYKSGLKTAPML